MSLLQDLIGLGGEYYLGEEAVKNVQETGERALGLGQEIGQTAVERSQFQPFTVTSSLATGATTPEGGLRLDLSPEEQRRQRERFRQAEGLYSTLGRDPRRMASAYYEDIRATQRPEEERQRLAMQQGLFSSGRGGISSAQYGGTPEQFAFEKARAEAQLGASARARELALAERDRQLEAAGLLTEAAYRPQREAIDLFGASTVPSQLAATGARKGAELAAQAERSGIEGLIQGEELANAIRLQQMRSLLTGLTGATDPTTGAGTGGLIGEIDYGGLFGSLFDSIGGLFGGGSDGQPAFVGGTIGGGGTSGGSAGASQAGAYTGEFGVGGPGNLVVDAANYLPEDYNILDD